MTPSGIKPATFGLVASCGGMSKRIKSKICPLFRGKENHIHIILTCTETQRWRDIFLIYKTLNVNENICFKKATNCTKITEIKK
jgi:hypothetical protein